MANQPCSNCGGSVAVPDKLLQAQPHSAVVASYGLCLVCDDFIEDKTMWVVDLQDGTKIFQDDNRPGLTTPSAWKRLGYYMQDFPENTIAKMRLRFGTHVVELPSGHPFYFYSRGLLQAITQTHGLDFHIVGWPNDSGSITCVWYKVPELVVTQEVTREISECSPEQLIGLTNPPGVI
jgi:hypothetical protein